MFGWFSMPKLLPKTLRERNRYIAFEVVSNQRPSRRDLVSSLWYYHLRLWGEYGASRSSLWLMDWDKEKARGIIKVNHKSVDDVRATLALTSKIDRDDALIHVLKVSGTLKKARQAISK
ncbi:MAG: ribonuclease P [Candidatus Altiarchaeales archaeon]|nr:ribonuclease P [Candidatus Altiarchaeales archaeon]